MSHHEELREQRQALNAAINNRDLETIKSYIDPAFVAKVGNGAASGRGGAYDKQALMSQVEQEFELFKDIDSQIEVEHVEASGDSAKLRVRRIERGRVHDPGHFWTFLAGGILCLAWAVHNLVRDPWRVDNAVMFGIASPWLIWWAFFHGRRSFKRTQRAEETWRRVDGRWQLLEELYLFPAGATWAGREYKSKARLLGLPLIHVAFGTGPDNRPRVAKGWIAIGNMAFGVLFAAGNSAIGGIALGAVSLGVVSLAGMALGVFAFGGGAVGLCAVGGVAVGVFAIGGVAIAWSAAWGGLAVAYEFALGGGAFATHANDAVAKHHIESNTLFSTVGASMPYLRWLWVLWILPPFWMLWMMWRARRSAEPGTTCNGRPT